MTGALAMQQVNKGTTSWRNDWKAPCGNSLPGKDGMFDTQKHKRANFLEKGNEFNTQWLPESSSEIDTTPMKIWGSQSA